MARALTLVAAILVGLNAPAAMPQALTQAEADSMGRKLQQMLEQGEKPRPKTAAPVRTAFTEREVNAYFKHYGPVIMPAGVVDPQVTIFDGGRVAARAIADLDAVRKSKERGWLDPMGYVTGSLEVKMAGKVLGANGVGVLQIESASVGGVAVSKSVLRELVMFYTKTPENPTGFDIDKPFAMPVNIRSFETKLGGATVVQ
jgi:hypothetical protein